MAVKTMPPAPARDIILDPKTSDIRTKDLNVWDNVAISGLRRAAAPANALSSVPAVFASLSFEVTLTSI